MDETKVIQAMLSEFEKEKALSNRVLKQLPRGNLRVTRNGPGRISFFREYRYESTKKRKGIGRDEEMIYRLAHKAFLQEKVRRLDENIRRLRQMKTDLLSLDPADILSTMPAHFDLLDAKRVIEAEKADRLDYPNPVFDKSIPPRKAPLHTGDLSPREWARQPYCANTKNMDHLTHRTAKGLWTRSKGEVAIVERYDALEIPYHYNEVLDFNGRQRSPDFGFARPDRKIIYHEHAGLKTQEYRDGLMDKLQLYASAGIRLGDNLILTFDDENGGINLQLVEALIRDRYFS